MMNEMKFTLIMSSILIKSRFPNVPSFEKCDFVVASLVYYPNAMTFDLGIEVDYVIQVFHENT